MCALLLVLPLFNNVLLNIYSMSGRMGSPAASLPRPLRAAWCLIRAFGFAAWLLTKTLVVASANLDCGLFIEGEWRIDGLLQCTCVIRPALPHHSERLSFKSRIQSEHGVLTQTRSSHCRWLDLFIYNGCGICTKYLCNARSMG